jgi:hypothetical protein
MQFDRWSRTTTKNHGFSSSARTDMVVCWNSWRFPGEALDVSSTLIV